MYLQRVNINGGWETIGTRTGYVGVNSPSARTFTNVKRNNGNDALRVKVDFDPRYLHPDAYTKSLITPLLFR